MTSQELDTTSASFRSVFGNEQVWKRIELRFRVDRKMVTGRKCGERSIATGERHLKTRNIMSICSKLVDFSMFQLGFWDQKHLRRLGPITRMIKLDLTFGSHQPRTKRSNRRSHMFWKAPCQAVDPIWWPNFQPISSVKTKKVISKNGLKNPSNPHLRSDCGPSRRHGRGRGRSCRGCRGRQKLHGAWVKNPWVKIHINSLGTSGQAWANKKEQENCTLHYSTLQ